ncbi:hypothetical protein CGRA01v4_09180 [Colletotrichum graminicola]|nr:hypothetical protein CGRA01v4_09180 [Colletotrichum graminicola]
MSWHDGGEGGHRSRGGSPTRLVLCRRNYDLRVALCFSPHSPPSHPLHLSV